MNLGVNVEAKLFFCWCCFYDHYCWWKEPFLQLEHPTRAVCQPGHGIPQILSPCFRNLRHHIRFILTGKSEVHVFHLSLPPCTKHRAFERDGLFLRMWITPVKTFHTALKNVHFLHPLSIQSKNKPFLRCTPHIIHFLCTQTEIKMVAFIWGTQRPQKSTTTSCTTVILQWH